MNFCELKELQAWSTVHIDLDKACNVLIMPNLIFGWDCGICELGIFSYELRLIFELILDSS